MDRKEENIALETKQIIRRCILKEKKKKNTECYLLLKKNPTNLRRIAHWLKSGN